MENTQESVNQAFNKDAKCLIQQGLTTSKNL